jgi:hypothetical protein
VFLKGPGKHLEETHSQEEVGTQNLRLNGENSPAKRFIEVVSAGNVAEPPAFGNTACRGARLAEVSQDTMTLEVQEFKDQKEAEEYVVHLFGDPSGSRVVRVQEEVHIEEAEKTPVMN